MTDALPDPPDLDPAALAASEFTRTRRGLEATEVRAALGRAADALRTWSLRDQQHRKEIEQLRTELEQSKELDESRIVSVLGEETARIVSAARDAATEIRTKAEEQAARLLAETDAQATAAAEALTSEATRLRDEAAALHEQAVADAARVRDEADTAAREQLADATERSETLIGQAAAVLDEKTAEAEAVAAELTAAAAAALEDAQTSAATTRAAAEADAADIVERARQTGREMIAEVREARERMLGDLAERRRHARRQIEGALAGRDRIIDVLSEAGRHVATTIEHLERVDEDANEAAEAAASTVDTDLDTELDQLRADLEAADPVEVAELEVTTVEVVQVAEVVEVVEHVPAESIGTDEVELDDIAESAATAETVDVTDTTATIDGGDGDTDDGADDGADEGDIGDVDDSDDEGDEDEGEGATVHDLFERIRAEGLDPSEPTEDVELLEHDEHEEQDEAGAGASSLGDVATTIDLTDPLADEHTPSPDAASEQVSEPLGDGALFDRRDALLVPVEKSTSRVLKRLMSDEQNEILDRLRRVKRGRPEPGEILPAADAAARSAWVDAIDPEFSKAVEAGATFWSEVAHSTVEPLFGDDAARSVLEERVGAFLSVHHAQLERVFDESEQRGDSAPELADRVRAAYRDWRSSSLSDLAGDLVTAGFAHGERRAAGPGTPWRWLVDNGGLPCADGEDNALGGSVPCEQPFPTGDLTPPAHPGCRCMLVPADR